MLCQSDLIYYIHEFVKTQSLRTVKYQKTILFWPVDETQTTGFLSKKFVFFILNIVFLQEVRKWCPSAKIMID